VLELSAAEREVLAGAEGPARQVAMRLVVAMGGAARAPVLIPITQAHVDGCLYHGASGLDFVRLLLDGGGTTSVPTTLNVGGLDLLHPETHRGEPQAAREAAELMRLYRELGCRPTYTCAPYQLRSRPGVGDHVAWAESNAIVFANSVLGARTNRYGDFLDIAAAIVGRVPLHGLHTDEGRRGGVIFDLRGLPPALLGSDAAFPALGHLLGREAGEVVPVLVGLPRATSEDQLKALGAAAASSGSVAMFHAVGRTPEAPTVEAAVGGSPRVPRVEVTRRMLASARDDLSTVAEGRLAAVSLGTPHASLAELHDVARILRSENLRPHPGVRLYVNTSRDVLHAAEAEGLTEPLTAARVELVVDTCTYVAPIMDNVDGPVMTNSGKWAYYAPANLGVDVVFGSLRECLRSAHEGRVWRDDELWHGV
jgi:predicted aconitase